MTGQQLAEVTCPPSPAALFAPPRLSSESYWRSSDFHSRERTQLVQSLVGQNKLRAGCVRSRGLRPGKGNMNSDLCHCDLRANEARYCCAW